MSTPNVKNTPEPLSFATFLEEAPPGSKRVISDLFLIRSSTSMQRKSWSLSAPDIQIHCATEACCGVRYFQCERGDTRHIFDLEERAGNCFLTYICRNCGKSSKTYALWVRQEQDQAGSAEKLGERPAFGTPLPNSLLKMVGDDSELLLKGRRTENQGLGIGAFVYYRRVVENQKDRLLTEIRKAAVRLEADDELLSSIDLATKETRFSESLKLVKDAIPAGLKVKGHNPLTLLHRALSKGVHGLDDTECLERAQAVRRVLTKLVSNIAQITKEERELDEAVNKLQSIK